MATYSFKSVGEAIDLEKFKSNPDKKTSYGFKTPLRKPNTSGLLDTHYSLSDQIRDNLKNLLLTNKGERLGQFNLGADLTPLAAEKLAKDDFDAAAIIKIRDAVSLYMPFIELHNFTSETRATEDSSVSMFALIITYDVPDLKIIEDKIELNILCVG